MLIKEYIINSPKSPGKAVMYGFRTDDTIYSVKFEGQFTYEQLKFLRSIPLNLEQLFAAVKKNGWQIKEVDFDLSFANFYERYGNTLGNKKRAENLWDKLPRAEKIKAINFIDKYENALKLQPGVVKCYADTYLNQQRWNN